MAVCSVCGKDVWRLDMVKGVCIECKYKQDAHNLAAAHEENDKHTHAASQIIVTTETAIDLRITERIDVISAEVVIGMNIFKDVASLARDVFGGRSNVMQKGLREARKAALAELRAEALDIGADAVIGVDLDYSEISGGGKSMLFLVASGTAVRLDKQSRNSAPEI